MRTGTHVVRGVETIALPGRTIMTLDVTRDQHRTGSRFQHWLILDHDFKLGWDVVHSSS